MSYDSESSLMKKQFSGQGEQHWSLFSLFSREHLIVASEPCVTKIYSYPAKLYHTIYTRVLAKDIVKKECKQ
jgi:hypothetical protein